jgi:hypothetical protein
VAGGGDFNDPLWSATNFVANVAYRTLLKRGVNKNYIRYFNFDQQQDLDNNQLNDDIFAPPSLTAIKEAIVDWAGSETGNNAPLVIYLVDHGGPKKFYVSRKPNAPVEIIFPNDLAGWLNKLQEKTDVRVTTIYDACNSGSFMEFLKIPEGKNYERINIFSTQSDELAYFGSVGRLSFSNFFWNEISQGFNVRQAFRASRVTVRSITQNGSDRYQRVIMDDNGDGLWDSQIDGVLASTTHFGLDAITATVFPQFIEGSDQGDLEVIANDTVIFFIQPNIPPELIKRVWLSIIDPDAAVLGSEAITEVRELDLSYNFVTDRYEVSSDLLNINGRYTVSFFVTDNDNKTILQPLVRFVTVRNGVSGCSEAARLTTEDNILHLYTVTLEQVDYSIQRIFNVGLKLQNPLNLLQFSLFYTNQAVSGDDQCQHQPALFSSEDGLLTIPSAKITIGNDDYYYENLLLQLQNTPPYFLELKEATLQ